MKREGGLGLDDGNIIELILTGDREAYRYLVRKYEPRVYAMCLKATNQPAEAEDLLQEVFLSAYRTIASFRGDAQFATWLYRITARKCVDWRRKAERDRPFQSDHELDVTEMASSETTPEENYVAKEQKSVVAGLLWSLPEPYRSTVQMYYIDERTYQEISTSTGISVKTVESRLYRARKMLKEKGAELR